MKPILFNSDMVRAILDERKTCTRRVVKPQPKDAYAIIDSDDETHTFDLLCGNRVAGGLLADWAETVKAPYWPGDFLYVRETWTAWSRTMGTPPVLYYKADGNAPDGIKWRPSIHMPKEAARIFLRVTNVRVEHLQDITEEQAVAEGALPVYLSVDSEDTPYSDRTWHTDANIAMPGGSRKGLAVTTSMAVLRRTIHCRGRNFLNHSLSLGPTARRSIPPIPLASSLRSTATGLRSRSTSRSRRPSSYAAWLICLAHGCRHAGLWKCWTLVGRPRSTAICSSQKTRPDTRSWIDSPCYRVKKTFGLV